MTGSTRAPLLASMHGTCQSLYCHGVIVIDAEPMMHTAAVVKHNACCDGCGRRYRVTVTMVATYTDGEAT